MSIEKVTPAAGRPTPHSELPAGTAESNGHGATAVRPGTQPTSPAAVTAAFGSGWLLGELLATPPADAHPPSDSRNPLLRAVPERGVRVRQLRVMLQALQRELGPTEASVGPLATLDRVAATMSEGALDAGGGAALARELSQDLSVASPLLGRAFGVGYDLGNTCRLPEGAGQAEFEHLFGAQSLVIQEALADLASALPPHSARGVSLSLALWQNWARAPELSGRPVKWPDIGVQDALARQGQVWRSILSGDKLGTDMLVADDYLGAVRAIMTRAVRARRWLWLLVAGFVVALAGGVYLLIAAPGTPGKVGGAILSVLGALGISTASLKRTLASVTAEIERSLWDAELDTAIAEAMVVPPGDWGMSLKRIDLPPARGTDPGVVTHARIVHELALLISRPDTRRLLRGHNTGLSRPGMLRRVPTKKLDRLLHEDFTLRTLAGEVLDRAAARDYLPTKTYLGTDPDSLCAGAPGRLFSAYAGGTAAVVWTFSHDRIRDLQEVTNLDEARQLAQSPLSP